LLLEQLPEEQEMKNLLTQVRGASLAVLEIYLSRMWLAHGESVSFVAYLLGPGGEPAVELQICCHHSTTSKERSRSAVHLLHTQHRSVDASSMNHHCRFILLYSLPGSVVALRVHDMVAVELEDEVLYQGRNRRHTTPFGKLAPRSIVVGG
jgi:hypothetical protein